MSHGKGEGVENSVTLGKSINIKLVEQISHNIVNNKSH